MSSPLDCDVEMRDRVPSYCSAHELFTRMSLPVYPRNGVVDPRSVLTKGMGINTSLGSLKRLDSVQVPFIRESSISPPP
jgi:hypothetical protein